MNDAPQQKRSVIVERELAHPPEKIWRALTQLHLLEEWLMKNHFKLAVGHRFELRAEWAQSRAKSFVLPYAAKWRNALRRRGQA